MQYKGTLKDATEATRRKLSGKGIYSGDSAVDAASSMSDARKTLSGESRVRVDFMKKAARKSNAGQ